MIEIQNTDNGPYRCREFIRHHKHRLPFSGCLRRSVCTRDPVHPGDSDSNVSNRGSRTYPFISRLHCCFHGRSTPIAAKSVQNARHIPGNVATEIVTLIPCDIFPLRGPFKTVLESTNNNAV